MARLILTEKEKALPFWNDLDDAALGKAIKYHGAKFLTPRRRNGDRVEATMDMVIQAATVGMCRRAHEMNAGKWEVELEGVTVKGVPIGDWKITYERVGRE